MVAESHQDGTPPSLRLRWRPSSLGGPRRSFVAPLMFGTTLAGQRCAVGRAAEAKPVAQKRELEARSAFVRPRVVSWWLIYREPQRENKIWMRCNCMMRERRRPRPTSSTKRLREK